MKLETEDRKRLEHFFEKYNLNSFYHYFPLLYAISESTQTLNLERKHFGNFLLWAERDELYYPPADLVDIPGDVKKVWVSENKGPFPWKSELYDINFIYDLGITLSIKNFRKNVKKFLREHPGVEYSPPLKSEIAWAVVKKWYQKSERKNFTDFGYTEWLSWNLDKFDDLYPRIISVGDKVVAFTLWGKLGKERGIHLICKDVGWPYLQDYARYMTYKEMKEKGFELVNDGGDAGHEGIRIYKLKLRPKLIVPIWSWIRG